MHKRLLDVIVCPGCRSDLSLSIAREDSGAVEEGSLLCERCDRQFPIIRGIPRFLRDVAGEDDLRRTYADSFGHQWTTYDWLRDEDVSEFFAITDFSAKDLDGRVVLDAGCGGGRFLRFVAGQCAEIVGVDYSIAVDKARALTRDRHNVHLIQCDINWHPLKADTFDLAYSHGVLHHTPDTRRSFDCLSPLVKPGGTLYVALFREAIAPLRWLDAFWRTLLNRLPIPVLDLVCGAMSHLAFVPLARFWKRFFWFSLQRTHEIRKCCLYDWYGPRYHHEHSVPEVTTWYLDNGFENPRYINAWPYCPPDERYRMPRFRDGFRLGQLLGVRGTRRLAA